MAITLTSAALATAIKKPLEVAERLLPVASALVTRYGPLAPDAIQNEAVIRCSGWLANQPASACSRDQVGLPGGNRRFSLSVPRAGALRGWGNGPAVSLEGPPGRFGLSGSPNVWDRLSGSASPDTTGSRRGLHVPFPSWVGGEDVDGEDVDVSSAMITFPAKAVLPGGPPSRLTTRL